MNYKLSLFAATIACLTALTACGSSASAPASAPDAAVSSDRLSVVTTIFPEYDWAREILGDNPADAELKLLIDAGVDLHSYQPTASDMVDISTCDLFIYVGGESDEWVDDALKEAVNPDMVVLNLMDILGDRVREEEIVEGMQEDEHHDHDHAADEGHDHGAEEAHEHEEDHDHEAEEGYDHEEHHHEHGEIEYDEHVWLSLNNAQLCCESIANALSELDPDHAADYAANADAYGEKLNALDEKYRSTVSEGTYHTLLFGDRFPFRYMTEDYGLDYYAAFVGCSAETEASFETVTFLAGKLDELGLPCILTIEGPDHRIAETIVQNTASKDQKVLTMNSLQSITAQDAAGGMTYLSAMEDNLEVLKEALD